MGNQDKQNILLNIDIWAPPIFLYSQQNLKKPSWNLVYPLGLWWKQRISHCPHEVKNPETVNKKDAEKYWIQATVKIDM